MKDQTNAAMHDAYAADYDRQAGVYDCHIGDVLFGLCYEYIRPGQALLDAGIGSGLSAQLFARAGLVVSGFDFSLAMLEICRGKGIAAELKQHDILQAPWPFPAGGFDAVVSCGVFHFLPELEVAFSEARQELKPGGLFAFTTKVPATSAEGGEKFEQRQVSGFEIYSHHAGYIEGLLDQHGFERPKAQKCLVGEDIFQIWIARVI